MAALAEHIAGAASGVGSVLLVEGDAGMGKTRLLAEAAEMARGRLFRVGTSAADPGDAMVELSTLMSALLDSPEPILDRAALSETRSLPEQRYWLLEDIQGLLEHAAVRTPLLICLDDLQWTDGGTEAALRVLPNRLAAVPIAWILAYRPAVGPRRLEAAFDRIGAEKISLGPLDIDAVREMAAGLLDAEPSPDLLQMAHRAGGNPFLLAEVLRGLEEEHLIRTESGKAELTEPRLPGRVKEGMRRRLDLLSDPANEVAAAATSLGRRFTFDELAAMLDKQPSALLAPTKELVEADLFEEEDETFFFRHDIILEAVRATLPESVARSLDRRAATVLIASGALPLEVSTRLAASAELGDEAAISTLSQAAETLDMIDAGASADLTLRALDITPRNHPLRQTLVAQTAIRLYAAGRIESARTFADTVLRQAMPPEVEAEFRLIIAAMFAISPDVRADSCRRGLALPNVSPFLRMLFMTNLFHNLISAGRRDEARGVLPDARNAIDDVDLPCGYFVGDLAESCLNYAEDSFSVALDLVGEARRNGEVCALDTSLSPQHIRIMQGRRFLTTQWLCDVLTILDRFDEALQISQQGILTAQREHHAWALNVFETGRGRQLLQMGRLADAAAALSERFSQGEAAEVVDFLDAAGVVALGKVGIHIGDRNLTRQAAEIAVLMRERGAPSVHDHAVWFFALQAMADGDPQRSYEWLLEIGRDEVRNPLPRLPRDIDDDIDVARIALAAGDNELAEHAVRAAGERSERNPGLPTLRAVAMHARGLVRRSEEDLSRAVALYESGPRPLALASALEDLGVLSVAGGSVQDGVGAFSRALEIYADMGATWDAGRTRGRLRSLGVRRRVGSLRRPERGWASLTASEIAVAQLVAEGLTNRDVAERLFISPHTVSGHLRNIFMKLNVKSRVELTRVVSGQIGQSSEADPVIPSAAPSPAFLADGHRHPGESLG
jgi:DNA-binding CsgD family transcriptional regulator/tetratricopeptide (TPR) repeat protein